MFSLLNATVRNSEYIASSDCEYDNILKEKILAYVQYYSRFCLKEVKTTRNVRESVSRVKTEPSTTRTEVINVPIDLPYLACANY